MWRRACRMGWLAGGPPSWQSWRVSEPVEKLEELVPEWLNLPDVAEQLGVRITRVHSLLEERALVAVRVTERGVRSVPADFLMDGAVLDSLKGTVFVLVDSGFKDEEIIRWLYTPDSSLPGRPIDALREGRKTEIRRRAQAAAW
jgi:hypothetical protein